MYISLLVFAIWFCISLLLISIILSDIGLSESYFSEPEFWLRHPVAGSHTQSSASEENKQQYWSKKISFRRRNQKWINSSPFNSASLAAFHPRCELYFVIAKKNCVKDKPTLIRDWRFLTLPQCPLLSPIPAPFTPLKGSILTSVFLIII